MPLSIPAANASGLLCHTQGHDPWRPLRWRASPRVTVGRHTRSSRRPLKEWPASQSRSFFTESRGAGTWCNGTGTYSGRASYPAFLATRGTATKVQRTHTARTAVCPVHRKETPRTPRLHFNTSLPTAHWCRRKPPIALSGDGLVAGPRGGFPTASGPEKSTHESSERARSPWNFGGNRWFFSEVTTLPSVLQYPRIQQARTSHDNTKTTERSTTAQKKPAAPRPTLHPPHLLPRGLWP